MSYKHRYESIFGKTKTFYITEDCNLRCRYCYEENKVKNSMNINVGLDAVDFFIEDIKKDFEKDNDQKFIWEFIGGEPFVEMDLIESVVEKIVKKVKENNLNINYQYISFTTNGTLFDDRVKNFLLKYKNIIPISVGLSLDGVKEIHDYNRSNSYDRVMKDFNWWRKHFYYNSIKSTLNRESLPHIFDSIKFFIDDLHLDCVFMNTVFENIWQEGDPELYYEQLMKVADFLLENGRYEKTYLSLFDPLLLQDASYANDTWCGCGNSMIAVDPEGKLYPCLRFRTLTKQDYWGCGSIYTGIDYNKLLPFKFYHNMSENTKCNTCEYKTGCSWCPGNCYDELGTIFNRTTFYCEMHEMRHKANRYFFEKIAELEKKPLSTVLEFK